MRERYFALFIGGMLTTLFTALVAAQGDPGFNGKWELIPHKSSEIGLFRTLALEFQVDGRKITLIQKWGRKRSISDTLILQTGAVVNRIPIKNRVWPTNVFMGISMKTGATRNVVARWEENRRLLEVKIDYPILASQGERKISSTHRYRLSPDNQLLTYTIFRDTRPDSPACRYLLKRAGVKNAYFMHLQDNWKLDGLLPVQAFLISLQGVVNKGAPRLYFIYPKSWPFHYTPYVFDFYKNEKNFVFTELKTPKSALQKLKQFVKGYIIWDRSVRSSLLVAFTVAGLEQAVVVSEELIPLVNEAGLELKADLRGIFAGKSDAEIYRWAYKRYWERCSRDFIIWMGGEPGNIMKPGVADWGIYQHAFFSDLSTRPDDEEEYVLANKLLEQLHPMAMVMGWHSYAKDLEREYVSLVSRYGHRVEGLHTLPNLSFSSQVEMSPGFQFKNRHHLVPGKRYVPEKKVYISCIQTDGLGIGAWFRPGRGEIPYAWEVIMNYSWLAPAMMEFFYRTATLNDYFIGALSGPGYIYPKAVPPDLLPGLIKEARRMMNLLDLQVFEIMDYSEGATVEGNTELTRRVVEAYYQGMPDAIGFVNGYAPAFTFTVKDGRPLISYDYYLSPGRKESEAVADLYELARINSKRPYFLLMHVRESSDVRRVKGILEKLGPEFEVVPLDLFMKLAGKQPTFKERFLEK